MPITLMLSHKVSTRRGTKAPFAFFSYSTVTWVFESGRSQPSSPEPEEISTPDLQKELMEKVVKTVIPANLLDDKTVFHIAAGNEGAVRLLLVLDGDLGLRVGAEPAELSRATVYAGPAEGAYGEGGQDRHPGELARRQDRLPHPAFQRRRRSPSSRTRR
jgi:hypothetical protein